MKFLQAADEMHRKTQYLTLEPDLSTPAFVHEELENDEGLIVEKFGMGRSSSSVPRLASSSAFSY